MKAVLTFSLMIAATAILAGCGQFGTAGSPGSNGAAPAGAKQPAKSTNMPSAQAKSGQQPTTASNVASGTAGSQAKPGEVTAGPALVVTMTEGKSFVPRDATITAGQTIEWKNTSQLSHSVTCDPSLAAHAGDVSLPSGAKPFNSGSIAPGKTYTHTFTVPGTYHYFCTPHELEGMLGTVTVQPAEAKAPGLTTANSGAAFVAQLAGASETTPVDTKATGRADFHLDPDGKQLHYTLTVRDLDNVTMAHLHMAPKGQNGDIVAWLYPDKPPAKLIAGASNGQIIQGTIDAARLQGPLQGKTVADLVSSIKAGDVYVQVHTKAHPDGEIRGQVQ